MNKKTINAVITKKMNAWIKTLPEDLQARCQANIIVTGGSIASLLLGEQVNDYDVYFRNKETAKLVAKHYCQQFNERDQLHKNKLGYKATAWVLDGEDVAAWKAGKIGLSAFAADYLNQNSGVEEWGQNCTVSHMITNCETDRLKVIVRSDGVSEAIPSAAEIVTEADEVPAAAAEDDPEVDKHYPVFLSTNAISLSGRIQLVVRFYGEPEGIHENYDFVHCTNYWTFGKGLVLQQPALEALMAKELLYIGSKYPLCSVIRTRKFLKRGFHINAGQYLKMCFQISQLDLTDIDVLEDQLIGVDSIYFNLLVMALRDKKAKDDSFAVTAQYVTSIVDRVF